MRGALIISLDFELFWGVHPIKTPAEYGAAVLGTRVALPGILQLFREYDIRATFATVGALFFRNKSELIENLPQPPVRYKDPKFDWYPEYLDKEIGQSEEADPYHFAGSLVDLIVREGRHEMATHTFSHCFALEEKLTPDAFRIDLERAMQVAKQAGVQIESLVFPGNQYGEEHIRLLSQLGLRGYRGNEQGWMYEPRTWQGNHVIRRLARLFDAYVNLTGHQTYERGEPKGPAGMFNIRASRFLRPFNTALKPLDGLRLRRIKRSMTDAAMHGRVFHLWWHPHNFGTHTEQNLGFLRSILEHYRFLRDKYQFQSLTMRDCYPAENIENGAASGGLIQTTG